jgi:hypothetical protein
MVEIHDYENDEMHKPVHVLNALEILVHERSEDFVHDCQVDEHAFEQLHVDND